MSSRLNLYCEDYETACIHDEPTAEIVQKIYRELIIEDGFLPNEVANREKMFEYIKGHYDYYVELYMSFLVQELSVLAHLDMAELNVDNQPESTKPDKVIDALVKALQEAKLIAEDAVVTPISLDELLEAQQAEYVKEDEEFTKLLFELLGADTIPIDPCAGCPDYADCHGEKDDEEEEYEHEDWEDGFWDSWDDLDHYEDDYDDFEDDDWDEDFDEEDDEDFCIGCPAYDDCHGKEEVKDEETYYIADFLRDFGLLEDDMEEEPQEVRYTATVTEIDFVEQEVEARMVGLVFEDLPSIKDFCELESVMSEIATDFDEVIDIVPLVHIEDAETELDKLGIDGDVIKDFISQDAVAIYVVLVKILGSTEIVKAELFTFFEAEVYRITEDDTEEYSNY